MKKIAKILSIFGCLCCLTYFGYWIVDGFSIRFDDVAKKDYSTEINKKLPIGITSNAAQAILRKEGYKCKLGTENINFLYCRKRRHVLLGSYSWLVSLEIERDKVKHIKTDINSSSL